MATYNGATYLSAQLASLARQTHLPMELVVADDGSLDNTLAVIEEFQHVAPFEVRVVATDGGFGPTRNFERAMRACRGDVVFYCDQDDRWHADKIARMIDAFAVDTTMVICDANLVDQDMRPLGTTLWRRLNFTGRNFQAIEHLARHTIAFGLTMAYRNDDWFRDLLFPIPMPFGHDNFAALLAACVGEVAVVDTPLVDYRQHSRQVSGTRGKKSAMQVSITPTARSFEALIERVPSSALTHDGVDLYEFCDAKARHLRTRERVVDLGVVARTKAVFDHIRAGEYNKYSNGWRSALKDMLGRP